MKKINLGQTLNTAANLGVIVGILLLVSELNQNREFASFQFENARLNEYQSIEREFLGPNLLPAWFKSMEDSRSLTATEIRVLDSYFLSHVLNLQLAWRMERAGFAATGLSFDESVRANVPFYFGNRFAQIWWDDTKSNFDPDFVERMEAVLQDVDPNAQRNWISEMQEKLAQ